MSRTWVLVADSAAARIFAVSSPTGPLEEVRDFAHPEARALEQRLTSDRPGRAYDSAGRGRHAMQSPVTPKEQEAIGFAKLLSDELCGARARGEIDRLCLVAAPAFLGHLRSALDTETRRIVEAELDLNLVRMKPEQIRSRLPEKLFSGLQAH
jgi:protein required for attachment to host cells